MDVLQARGPRWSNQCLHPHADVRVFCRSPSHYDRVDGLTLQFRRKLWRPPLLKPEDFFVDLARERAPTLVLHLL